MMTDENILFYFVGDVGPRRKAPDSIFQHVESTLKKGDIVFCQLESNLSQRGTRLPQARLAMRTDPESALAIKRAGFHIIQKAKRQADLVIVSMHWGIHFVPAIIANYQKEVGHTAIDCGADLIIGHHPHILKGIEIYKGKVIFYSLGNFALEPPYVFAEEGLKGPAHQEIQEIYSLQKNDRQPLPPDSMKTIIGKSIISDRKIKEVSFLPTYINNKFQPEILNSVDIRFNKVVKYLEQITRDQGFDTKYFIEGEEVILYKKE